MNLKISSFIAFAIGLSGLIYLINKHYIISQNPITIAIQLSSVAFMIWARIIFGLRSFHVTANSTKGELVTSGPYRWLRHPIYASIIYFSMASIISFPFIDTIAAVALIVIGLFGRMILEEKSLLMTYENYAEYCKKAKRIIPFLF